MKVGNSEEYNFDYFSSLTSSNSPKSKNGKLTISNFEKKEVLKPQNLENLRTLIKKTQQKINSSLKTYKLKL